MKFNESILLSVIIPIYNVELYLSRCLESIIKQTYHNLEIICVDDGSTDKSGKIADEYAKRDKRIKVIHKTNGGLVSARKAGIQMAKGEYISNIDSDDYIEPNMYCEMMSKIVSNNADVITSGLIRDYGNHFVYENESIEEGIYEGENLRKNLLFRMIDTESFFRYNISSHITNKIFKADELKKYQLMVDDSVNAGEDVAVCFPYFINQKKIIVSGKNYYHYCVRNDSISGVKKKDDLKSLNTLFFYLGSEIKKIQYRNNYDVQLLLFQTYTYLYRDASRILKIRGNELFPFGRIDKTKSIVLYGAGKFGAEIKNFLDRNGYHVVAWVDKSKNREGVVTLADIQELDYDVIIIGTLLSVTTCEIKEELINHGIKHELIFSINENMLINELLNNSTKKE